MIKSKHSNYPLLSGALPFDRYGMRGAMAANKWLLITWVSASPQLAPSPSRKRTHAPMDGRTGACVDKVATGSNTGPYVRLVSSHSNG